MNNDVVDSWEKFLNPNVLRGNLIAASIFITSYEILKNSIIDQIKSFYTHGFDANGPIVSEGYKAKVLALDAKGNHFRASIAWLKANSVINAKDEQVIAELTQHRNEVAHDLPKFLSETKREVELARLTGLIEIVTKIDRWWIINVELAIQDEINPDEVIVEHITSSNMVFLHLLLTAAGGAESNEIFKEFLRRTSGSRKSVNTNPPS